MPLKSSVVLTTRTSDLDARRHVNNRVYEQFCSEGRYWLLADHGYPLETLLARSIVLRPAASYVKFSLQQKAGAALTVQTEAFPLGEGLIVWNHHLTQPDGQTVCVVQAKTQTIEQQQPVDLLPAAGERPGQMLIEEVPGFSGQCERFTSTHTLPHTDMDVFGAIPLAAGWRLFEEGRHQFGQRLGLTRERLVELDTHIFWMGGTYQFYQALAPGQTVRVHTWLERLARIRVFIRQAVTTLDGAECLGATREEHLTVSLSASRPKAPPPELAAALQPYVEHPG